MSSEEKTKRDEYLEVIRKRKRSPQFSHIIEETVKHTEQLLKDKKANGQQKGE